MAWLTFGVAELLAGLGLVTMAATVVRSWFWDVAVAAIATPGCLLLVTGSIVILRAGGIWSRAPIGSLNAVTFLSVAFVGGLVTAYLLMVFALTGSLAAAESGGDPGPRPWDVLFMATVSGLLTLGALALLILFAKVNDVPGPPDAGVSEPK